MKLDQHKVERALYEAGLTSYPYSTAEALRFMRAYGDIEPTQDCEIVRNGDQYLCLYHRRYWSTGICPGRL